MGSDPNSGSNVLMFVAVVAVAFALFGLIVTINKMGDINAFAIQLAPTDTETGEANLTILGVADIFFTKSAVNWTDGSANSTCGTTELETRGVVGVVLCGHGFANDTGLILENQGNSNGSVTLQTSNNASTFIPSPDASSTYQWAVIENSVDACTNAVPSAYTNVNDTDPFEVCPVLRHESGFDQLRIDLNVTFTSEASPGDRISIIFAVATTV